MECKSVGLHLGEENVIDNIAKHPQWFAVLISHSELGLLKRVGDAIVHLKQEK
jgi:hypothetical protein